MRIFNQLILLSMICSLSSCHNELEKDYLKIFKQNEKLLEETVDFTDRNYAELGASECVEKLGISINNYSVNETNCYNTLTDSLAYFLKNGQEVFYDVNVQTKSNILFAVDFISYDFQDKEVTRYFLFYQGTELPERYQKWIGEKIALKENWWYIEDTNAKY